MDNDQLTSNRPPNRRRRKKSRLQIFKETYLPVVILAAAALLILIFIIGSITRGIQKLQYKQELSQKEAIAASEAQEALDAEAENVVNEAMFYASQFDYERAINCIDSFSGKISDYSEMQSNYDSYKEALASMVLWDDPASVLNLSFQMLMSDPARCYNDSNYGSSYNRNFVTVEEFQKILQQLYDNNYILVSLGDLTDGEQVHKLYLPEGKKPLMITQTNINYYRYMIDSDGDWLPDQQGAGFASRLVINENDAIVCEMVDSDGSITTGYYDLIPILESFITTHPDFSYKGAKAVLAVTGYDGIFGYRTNPAAAERLGEDYFLQEKEDAARIVARLRELGYEFACYTYENEPYGGYTAQQISAEMQKWESEVTPILGETDIFVFARDSDIENPSFPYSDDRYNALKDAGFSRFLGFCEADQAWFYIGEGYIRMGRILVSGSAMAHNHEWFDGMFDAASILDPARGEVPS